MRVSELLYVLCGGTRLYQWLAEDDQELPSALLDVSVPVASAVAFD